MRSFFLVFAFSVSFVSHAEDSGPTLESVEEIFNQLNSHVYRTERELSVEEALEAIGNRYPELRSNFILMHNSRSRQGASYEYPRVIAHTEDARFGLTFNGDPNAKGFYEIEMYDFGSSTLELNGRLEALKTIFGSTAYLQEGFRFRRLIFKPRSDYPHVNDYQDETTFPIAKPINEPLCLSCHGAKPRPNWEAYNVWNGAYFKRDNPSPGVKYRLGYQTADHDGFDLFYTRQAGAGRYAFLVGLDDQFLKTSAYPKRIATSQYTQVAGYLNYRRIAHLILQSPDYSKYRYAVIGALYNCDQFTDFLPDHIRSAHSGDLDDYVQKTKELFVADENSFHLSGDEEWVGKVRYLFEGRGISVRKWSMSFRRSAYSMVTPGGDPSGFISSTLMEYDQELEHYRVWKVHKDAHYSITSDFSKPWTGSMTSMVAEPCRELKEMSRNAWN